MKHKTFSFLLAVLMSMVASVASAHDFEVDGIYYKITSSATPYTVSVMYRGSSSSSYFDEYKGSVTIPESVTYGGNTYSVTSIGSGAFQHCTGLTSVTIPNSVTSIGDYAFGYCNLTSVTIPESVTSIGSEAFYYCNDLTSVTIPNSVTSIGEAAFEGTKWYNNQPNGLIYAGKVAYKYKGTMPEGTEIILKEGTLGIAGSAFRDCSGLTSVTIPESVTSIGNYAFYKCSGLTSVTIPESVTSIGDYAFRDCSGLTSVTIPESVTSIGDYAFRDCSGLTSFTIPESVTRIGNYAFYNCSGPTSVTIPESVTSIGSSAFYGCKLRNLAVKCAAPPTSSTDSFSEQTQYHTILYIPMGAWDAYAYDNAWYKFINIRETASEQEDVNTEMAYTLMDARTFNYAVYDPVNNRIRMVASVNVDESDPNHCWQTMEVSGRKFLYNIGARKFAVPTTDGTGFTLSDEAGSITMADGKDGIILGGDSETQWALVGNDRMSIDLSVEETVTAVETVKNEESGVKDVYDLSGRRMNVSVNVNDNVNNSKFEIQNSKLKNGIYIVNGRKTVVR